MKVQPKRKAFWTSGHWGALCALTLLWVFTRCSLIDRELEDCYSGAYLRFEYLHPKSHEDLFRHQVEAIELYVYDQDGYFHTMKSIACDALPADNTYSLEWLTAGEYTLLAWGRQSSPSGEARFISEYDCHIEQMRYGLQCEDGEGLLTTRPGHLFYGRATLTGNPATEEHVVSMQKNSKDIHILLEPASKAVVPELAIRVTARNGSYNLENLQAPQDGRLMQYNASFTASQTGHQQAELTLMRLWAHDQEAWVTIYDRQTGTTYLHTGLMTELLKGNSSGIAPQEYLDAEDEYTLTYEYDIDESGVMVLTLVSVNDWQLSPGNGGI